MATDGSAGAETRRMDGVAALKMGLAPARTTGACLIFRESLAVGIVNDLPTIVEPAVFKPALRNFWIGL